MKFKAFSFVLSRRFGQKVGVWTSVIAGHALIGLALCLQLSGPAEKPVGDQGTMVTVSLVSSTETAGQASQVQNKPQVEAQDPLPKEIDGLEPATEATEPASPTLSAAEMELVSSFQPATMGEPGAACDLTRQLATAFGSSPEVRQGIAAIPSSGRSVANAVMLWDGHWAANTQGEGMAVLRALLVKAVVSSRPECLLTQNQGPVLFLIPENGTTVVLAIGSGQWRWADVLAPSPRPDLIASIF